MSFFRRSSSRPQRQQSDPIHGQQPAVPEDPSLHPSKFGPHFQKGQKQEEIYERRAEGEKILRDHPDLQGRAHTFHPPRQIHEFTVPFVKIPQTYSRQMAAEHTQYKFYEQQKDNEAEEAIRRGVKVPTGPNTRPRETDLPMVKAGLAGVSVRLVQANTASQARAGFTDKYPQAYETLEAQARHNGAIASSRTVATKLRGKQIKLVGKHNDLTAGV